MRNLAIIHFNPIELYPPIMNLLSYFSASRISFHVHVYTMHPPESMLLYSPVSRNIKVIRKGSFTHGLSAGKRYFNYFLFYSSVFFHCIRSKPGVFLIYETLSFLPVWLYRKCFRQNPALLFHYHEYMTPDDMKKGMKLNKWIHRMEERSYASAAWVSHTNAERMEMFIADHPQTQIPNRHILPNYPSENWRKHATRKVNGQIKIIYVGALSLETMFIEEFAKWVLSQNGEAIWHIYSNNLTSEVNEYINKLASTWIVFKGACEYNRLPELLPEYDAGVILYKGHIPNYVYNAPNKLFEYLACGLDVWVPDIMKGCLTYLTTLTWPKVIALNFNELNKLHAKDLVDRKGLIYKPSSFFYESELNTLLEKINSLLPPIE